MDLLAIPRIIDISAVRADVTLDELDSIVDAAKTFKFICAFAMPCFTRRLVEKLSDEPDVMVGGAVGFPSGAETTYIKISIAKELMSMGVNELDMVTNVGALKSGKYDMFRDDIRAVVDAANGMPVKSILEVPYLTDDEIKKGAELAVEAGVTYVKTGTGWGPRPTTVHDVEIIKSTIGDAALIKVAGGVRNLDTLLDMVNAGCNRFGIGIRSVMKIIQEAYDRCGKNLPEIKHF